MQPAAQLVALDLQRRVRDAETVVQHVGRRAQEGIVACPIAPCAGADEMRGQRGLGRAHRPDMEVVDARDAVHGEQRRLDFAGVDIGWHRDPSRIENIRDALCAEDRWGQKKGAGFYDYDDKRAPSESPRVAEIIEDFRKKSGAEQHEISDQEIIERTLYTMVNEGAKILAEGKAQRASDIDVVWVYGYGWPPYKGGPMFWAGQEGLKKIVEGLEKHGFDVAPLLREKAEKGESF